MLNQVPLVAVAQPARSPPCSWGARLLRFERYRHRFAPAEPTILVNCRADFVSLLSPNVKNFGSSGDVPYRWLRSKFWRKMKNAAQFSLDGI
jgi:hypothetical protein